MEFTHSPSAPHYSELLAVDALPHGARFQPIAVGAAHMHLPAQASRHA
jgi:hypothetical protein